MAAPAPADERATGEPVAIADLPLAADYGFSGGRDSFRDFCGRIFAPGMPRLLRGGDGDLLVFRHRDLQALGTMPQIGAVPPAVLFGPLVGALDRGEAAVGANVAHVITHQVFTANPPIHKPVRRLLTRQFGPKQARQMEGLATAVADAILDEVAARDRVDIVHDVAEKLTCRFWGTILGMTAAEQECVQQHVRAMTPLFFIERDAADSIAMDAASGRYGRAVEQAALRSLAGVGGHPLIADMARDLAEVALDDDPARGGVVPRNVGQLLAGNLVDGFHTAALAAANTIFVLAHHPGAMAAIGDSPERLAGAIFEALRLEPPVIFLKRWALEEVIHAGVRIPAGAQLTLMWGAGGHDPAAFPDPARFDPARPRQGSTTFGMGAHICPGQFVAGMLVKVLMTRIIERGIVFAPLDTPPHWIGNHAMSQLAALPMRVA